MTRIAARSPDLQNREPARLDRPPPTRDARDESAPATAYPGADSSQPGPTRRAPNSMKAMLRSGQLVKLPETVVDQVASFLGGKDMVSLSQTDKATRGSVQGRMDALLVAQSATQISTLEEFTSALQQVRSTRGDLRSEPLRQIMSRINCLPEEDRQQALDDFDDLAAETPDLALPWRDQITAHPDARAAVMAGQHVQLSASCFQVTEDHDIQELEDLALRRDGPNSVAGDAGSGASVRHITQKHGIVTAESIRAVENVVIGIDGPGTARRAVAEGAIPREVGQRYGVSRPHHIAVLTEISIRSRHPNSAGGAVANGANVQTVARRFGITDPDDIWSLNRIARDPRR